MTPELTIYGAEVDTWKEKPATRQTAATKIFTGRECVCVCVPEVLEPCL